MRSPIESEPTVISYKRQATYWWTDEELERLRQTDELLRMVKEFTPEEIASDLSGVQPMPSSLGQIFVVKPSWSNFP